MQDEIGNRAARLWFRVRRTPQCGDLIFDQIDKWMTVILRNSFCKWLQNPAYSFSEPFSLHRFKLTNIVFYFFLDRYGKYPVSIKEHKKKQD